MIVDAEKEEEVQGLDSCFSLMTMEDPSCEEFEKRGECELI